MKNTLARFHQRLKKVGHASLYAVVANIKPAVSTQPSVVNSY